MDVASKQQKTLKNVLYYGLPVLAILMIAVGWVLFSGSHPELMPAPVGNPAAGSAIEGTFETGWNLRSRTFQKQ